MNSLEFKLIFKLATYIRTRTSCTCISEIYIRVKWVIVAAEHVALTGWQHMVAG
jgi:hypothetical protein